jgi:hypothetical protein
VVAGFFFVLDILMTYKPPTWQWTYPQPPQPRLLITSVQALENVRAEGRQNEVDAIMLSTFWFSMHQSPQALQQLLNRTPPAAPVAVVPLPGNEVYGVLRELPNLRQVEYTCFGDPTSLDSVAQVTGCEYLTIDGICTLDLGKLRSLSDLRQLNIQTSKPPVNLAALAGLHELETIVVRSRMAINDELLVELARLPRLKVLVLDFGYSIPAEPRISEAGLATLAQSRSLETVYAGGRPDQGEDILPMVRKALPNLVVRPASAEFQPFSRAAIHFLPFGLLAGIVGAQLSSQFRSPLRRLAPGFGAAHGRFGILLALIIVAACALRFWIDRATVGAALAVATACVGIVIATMSTTSLGTAFKPQGVTRLTQLLIVPLWGMLSVLVVPSLSDRALHAPTYSILAALWLATAVSAGLGAWLLSRLVYWTTSGDWAGPAMTRKLFEPAGVYRDSWAFAGDEREARIEAWASRSSEDWTWWQRVDRWRCGNSPLRAVRMALIMLIAMVGIQTLVLWRVQGPRQSPVSFGLNFGAMMVLVMGVLQIGALWRARLLVLATELTRPYGRRVLQKEWMAAFLVDLLPTTILASLAAALAVNFEPPFVIHWHAVPWNFAMLLPIALTVAAGMGSVFVVVTRVWLAVTLTMFLMWLMPMAVFVVALISGGAGQFGPGAEFPREMIGQFWVAGLIGAILAVVMGRRFLKLEVGRRN